MIKKMNGFLGFTISILLACILIMEPLGAQPLMAAKKPTLKTKKATIAVCGKTTISLKDKINSAKYSYTSKNNNIATVSLKGIVTGKSAGKTKILIKQTLKGKVTNVGTFKVNVAKSKLNEKEAELFIDEEFIIKGYINYYNAKAKYKVASSNNSIVKVSSTGKIKAIQDGVAYVTVKETYNGKTRSLGKIKVTVYEEGEEDYYVDGEEDDDEEGDSDQEYEDIDEDEYEEVEIE